jgi:acyl carrier protein
MEIEVKIRDFVARNLLFSDNGFPHDDAASFLREGVIDSLGVLELVTFAAQQFGIDVTPNEITPANFDSVSGLADFIRRKQTSGKEVRCAGS